MDGDVTLIVRDGEKEYAFEGVLNLNSFKAQQIYV